MVEKMLNEIHLAEQFSDEELAEELAKIAMKHSENVRPRRIPITERKPHCFESGNWDGLRSEYVVVWDSNGDSAIARLYSGFIDGSEFNEFYSNSDFELQNIVSWMPLPD